MLNKEIFLVPLFISIFSSSLASAQPPKEDDCQAQITPSVLLQTDTPPVETAQTVPSQTPTVSESSSSEHTEQTSVVKKRPKSKLFRDITEPNALFDVSRISFYAGVLGMDEYLAEHSWHMEKIEKQSQMFKIGIVKILNEGFIRYHAELLRNQKRDWKGSMTTEDVDKIKRGEMENGEEVVPFDYDGRVDLFLESRDILFEKLPMIESLVIPAKEVKERVRDND